MIHIKNLYLFFTYLHISTLGHLNFLFIFDTIQKILLFFSPSYLVNNLSLFQEQNNTSLWFSEFPSMTVFYSEAWREKFTLSSMIQEHFLVSRFLLVLEIRDKNFLKQSFFAKKSPSSQMSSNRRQKSRQTPSGIELTVEP